MCHHSVEVVRKDPLPFPSPCPNLSSGAYLLTPWEETRGGNRAALAASKEGTSKCLPTQKEPHPRERCVDKSPPQEESGGLWGREGRGLLYILQGKPPGYLLLEGSHGVGYLSGYFTIPKAGFLSYTQLGCGSKGFACE